jgi:hypothetical protein
MGRRCLLTKERIDKICEGIKKGLTYDMCAKFAGVSPSAFYTWLRKGREGKEKKFIDFVSKLEQAEASGAVFHLQNITNNSKEDWKASAWILERRHNYTRYNSIQNQMQEQKQVSTDPKEILREQIKELKEAGNKALSMGSFQAYAALQRQQISAVMQLKQIESETIDDIDNATDEQILYEISSMILSLPPVLRQRLEGQLTNLGNPNVVSLATKKR